MRSGDRRHGRHDGPVAAFLRREGFLLSSGAVGAVEPETFALQHRRIAAVADAAHAPERWHVVRIGDRPGREPLEALAALVGADCAKGSITIDFADLRVEACHRSALGSTTLASRWGAGTPEWAEGAPEAPRPTGRADGSRIVGGAGGAAHMGRALADAARAAEILGLRATSLRTCPTARDWDGTTSLRYGRDPAVFDDPTLHGHWLTRTLAHVQAAFEPLMPRSSDGPSERDVALRPIASATLRAAARLREADVFARLATLLRDTGAPAHLAAEAEAGR